MRHGAGVPENAAFAQALDELKREGSNLLLVGEATPEAHAAASARLVGESSEPRRRLFVFTEGADVCADLPEDVDPTTSMVVSQGTDRGSATPMDLPPEMAEAVVDSEMLAPLAARVAAAIDRFESDADGLDPAELRLCFDSVSSLLADHDSENVFRLLHLVTSRVRQVNGMGHFHLLLDRDTDHVRLLEPMFDAVVELRVEDGQPQQRWHLRDRELTSDWMDL